jgi:Bacterial Ig-like domain (group 3)/FG-GAP-like repeat
VAITSGSFNGNVDLVVAGTEETTCTISGTSSGPFNGYVAVYPGDGNGDFGIPETINGVQTFAAPQPICVGENPTAIAVGDFNKDGNLDILVANAGAAESGAPSVQLLFGDGKGVFPTSQTISLSSNSGNLVSLSVADFNADTYPDFAVYDSNGNLSFYTNTGSASPGQFHLLTSLATAEPAGDGTSAYGAATGDFNSDGFPDVVTFFIQVPLPNTTQPPTAADGFLWIATDTASAQASLNTPAQSLQAGNRNITASFSGDTNLAASTSTPLPVTVSQTVPVITWNPESIVYPTPLGSAQLNATSTPVAGGGSFAYTPPAGTVLLPPMPSSSTPTPTTLKVAFTPADSFDYAPAAASANIFVTLSALSISSLSPASASVGATNTPPITIIGSGFETDAVVILDGSPLPASSVSYSDPDHLLVSLPNSTFSTAKTHNLSVNDPIDGEKSGTLVFTVAPPTVQGTVNVPTTATPGGQPPTIALTLNSPVDATVNISLTFTPDSSNSPSTNGSVNFSNGTTTDTIMVPANTTTPLPPVAFSPGTVAGTIAVAFSITAGGVDVTPSNLTTAVHVTVPPGIPAFQTVTLDCSSTGIQVIVQGYSTTREISAAQVVFTAAPGKSLQTSSFTISQAQQLFTSWYENPVSDSGGSSFTLTQPFTFQSGDSSDIGSVSVTLTNGQGPAQSTTAQCTSSTN